MGLESEFQWYLENQKQLVPKYNGRILVIKDNAVIGVYDDELTALAEASKSHTPGTFLLQRCTPGEEAYTTTFHSRVRAA
jgi:hypothetical protein